MTRQWAPVIETLQVAILAAIKAERDANRASMPDGMEGDLVEFSVGVHDEAVGQRPYRFHVRTPGNSSLRMEVTRGFEADPLAFPITIVVRGQTEEDALVRLREAIGLVVDGIAVDPTLGGLCAGPSDPAIELGQIILNGLEVEQELLLRLVVRA